MIVVNEGNKPTFVRGNQTSRIDVTMYTEDLGGKDKKWRVLDDESMSDYRYIIFEVDRTKEKEKQTEETRKWKITKERLRTLPANI